MKYEKADVCITKCALRAATTVLMSVFTSNESRKPHVLLSNNKDSHPYERQIFYCIHETSVGNPYTMREHLADNKRTLHKQEKAIVLPTAAWLRGFASSAADLASTLLKTEENAWTFFPAAVC